MSESFRTLNEWLSWLESLHPTEIELGLDRIRQVADRLNISAGTANVITVAGTNGKGSTCAMLDQILQAQGLKTARYSSPHLIRFNERVLINGQPVADEQLIHAFERVKACLQDVSLTYFEFTTLAAFWLFQQQSLDVWIMEVGLGGRLDAVNILDPDIAVVTSIALDHQDWLGSDLGQIGREKAGVARPNKPIVCGQVHDIDGVRQVAHEIGAQLFLRNRDFEIIEQTDSWQFKGMDGNGQPVMYSELPYPDLPLQNAATALQVLSLLPAPIEPSAIKTGLQQASLSGRMQSIERGSQTYVLDVAHNPQAAELLANLWHCKELPSPVIILGMLSDKDIAGTLQELSRISPQAWWLVDLPGARGQTASQLANYDAITQVGQRQFHSVEQALRQAETQAGVFLICGSFLTVGAALEYFQQSR